MNYRNSSERMCYLLLAIVFASRASMVCEGQSKRTNDPKAAVESGSSVVSFDTLLSADSYQLYGEVRMVGQQARLGGLLELLEPFRLFGSEPEELRKISKFVITNADALGSSRLFFASLPARSKLPQLVIGVEMPSPEEAAKFEPRLTKFMTGLVTPPPPPPPPANPSKAGDRAQTAPDKGEKPAEPQPNFFVKRQGSLLILSDKNFTFSDLRPKKSVLLSEDTSFRLARDRFQSEALFLYINIALTETQHPGQVSGEEVPTGQHGEPHVVTRQSVQSGEPKYGAASPAQVSTAPPSDNEAAIVMTVQPPPKAEGAPVATTQETSPSNQKENASSEAVMRALGSLLDRGVTEWPQAAALAIGSDGDLLVVRALLLDAPGKQSHAVPFIPLLITGPALAPGFSNVLPDDTEIVIEASLDLPKIFNSAVSTAGRTSGDGDPRGRQANNEGLLRAQIAGIEKKYDFKVDELLAAVGNEVVVSFPIKNLGITGTLPGSGPPPSPSVVLMISLKDRETVQKLLPRVLQAFGFGVPEGMLPSEGHEDVQVVSFGGLSFGFIGDYLVYATDPKALNQIADSFTSHKTLSTNPDYKNSANWQPQQVLGQIYISKALMDGYRASAKSPLYQGDPEIRDLMGRYDFAGEPISYALVGDGTGMLHEAHIPRNLIAMSIASMAVTSRPSVSNQAMAIYALTSIQSAESRYKEAKGQGSFAPLDVLVREKMLSKYDLERVGYRIDLTASGERFEATAVPTEYGKSGFISFFVDESGVLRAGDHAGQRATVADKPLDQ
jgi:hypothetical protein